MRITLKFNGEVAVMHLEGQFVAGGDGPFLRQKVKDLIEAGTKKLIINFSGVPYIDSTGLGFLAGSRVTAESGGATMVLASINAHVMRILDEVRLSQFFVIANDEADALTKLNEKDHRGAAPGPTAEKESIEAKEAKAKKRPRARAE